MTNGARRVLVEDCDRFWSLVDRRGPTECWEWTGQRQPDGYGVFDVSIDGKRIRQRAHRISYTVSRGQPKQTLDHLCRNRACVNPNHLEDVSNKVNVLRGNNFAGINARKTHCIHGHEFTSENTYYRPSKNGERERECKACGLAIHTAYRRRKAAAKQGQLIAISQEAAQ